jgi:hypothetical protein
LVTGGVHGYETSGVHGALEFVERYTAAYEGQGNRVRMLLHIDLHETTSTDETEFRPALAAPKKLKAYKTSLTCASFGSKTWKPLHPRNNGAEKSVPPLEAAVGESS